MGRNKEFDPDAALRSALDLFWRKGYEATSMQDLVDHLGVNRGSLYATFGSKHALYLRALDRYCELKGEASLELLGRPGPALPAVRELLLRYAAETLDDPDRKGCLVTNTAVEVLPGDEQAERRVASALDELETAVAGALVRARHQGELAEGADPRALARFFVTFLQGLRVVGKTADGRRRVEDAVDGALSVLR
ncbi:TetR/AcrR family transcriptional regulator [Streptomyces mobaraensis NBRC 13819 = DSM 40847]|uniref:TetR family transcriptional regulator n=1 Tax=Streptomyces mobaraensis (strain ATCC 29032 / DSM 40847 / JCM 4168 / NBRC 13819 / NCIMB 11159 / IPCR 16-22) TaxID=1223523 RepID=M3BCC7_STRM1|nr:TetR/AcrR family transcriptional regulator [Streptomyces mobaraensis]EME97219.1 TetR family transcriptional regulator [Streptomyces mobaraensis NBRC 13819 = DSM 40847]QTT72971.1 TetR/AcrR family transcriptional regulator [Streptomyces mobaraensis NBRC 13819 = DSM 40847]